MPDEVKKSEPSSQPEKILPSPAPESAPKAKAEEPKRRGRVKSFFVSLVNVKKWVSYDEIKSNAKVLVTLFKRLKYRKPELLRKETYEEAIKRMNLSEEQLLARKKGFLRFSLLYLVIAIGLLFYTIHLLTYGHVFAILMSLVLSIFMFTYAYHDSFWYMQMQKKKLGCTFREWLLFIFRRAK